MTIGKMVVSDCRQNSIFIEFVYSFFAYTNLEVDWRRLRREGLTDNRRKGSRYLKSTGTFFKMAVFPYFVAIYQEVSCG